MISIISTFDMSEDLISRLNQLCIDYKDKRSHEQIYHATLPYSKEFYLYGSGLIYIRYFSGKNYLGEA